MIEKFDGNKIIEAIRKKLSNPKCPMCGNDEFSLLEGFVKHYTQSTLNAGIYMGQSFIPSVITYCNKCGFINFHALAPLGLMEN